MSFTSSSELTFPHLQNSPPTSSPPNSSLANIAQYIIKLPPDRQYTLQTQPPHHPHHLPPRPRHHIPSNIPLQRDIPSPSPPDGQHRLKSAPTCGEEGDTCNSHEECCGWVRLPKPTRALSGTRIHWKENSIAAASPPFPVVTHSRSVMARGPVVLILVVGSRRPYEVL
jgi:hypothetical protein